MRLPFHSNEGVEATGSSSGEYLIELEGGDAVVAEPLAPGQILAGKYRIERVIGEGAMGIVVAATHLELDEIVAIKVIRPEAQKMPGVLARFAREAKALARIKSEHAAKVLDVGIAEGMGPFIVMEYLEGRDLREVLRTEGPLPIRRAVDYVMQACEALAHAHVNGITHRDIKPENLFLTRRVDLDIVKVLDFGISKAALRGSLFGGDPSLLQTSMVIGTPLYMSPEQIRGSEEVDHRADVWSLGAVLYELVCHRTAFAAESLTQVCGMILERAPAPLRDHCPQATPELQAVIERCLEKDPANRFQSVGDLAVALIPFAPSRARVFAEQAVSLLRVAGIAAEVELEVRLDSSAPPPSSEGDTVIVTIPGDPGVPSATPTLVIPRYSGDETVPAFRAHRRWLPLLVAGAVVCATAVVLAKTTIWAAPSRSATRQHATSTVVTPAFPSVASAPVVAHGDALAAATPEPGAVPPPIAMAAAHDSDVYEEPVPRRSLNRKASPANHADSRGRTASPPTPAGRVPAPSRAADGVSPADAEVAPAATVEPKKHARLVDDESRIPIVE